MHAPVFNGIFKNIVSKIMKNPEQGVFLPKDGGRAIKHDSIFFERYQETDERGIPYGAPRPVAYVEKGLFDADYGDKYTIQNTTYIIREVQPESDQYTKIILQDNRR